jgi:hypothetical protein
MPQNELEYTVALLFFGTQKGRPTKSCARKNTGQTSGTYTSVRQDLKRKGKNKGENLSS